MDEYTELLDWLRQLGTSGIAREIVELAYGHNIIYKAITSNAITSYEYNGIPWLRARLTNKELFKYPI